MPSYLIKPEATHLDDPTDTTGAVLALGVDDPETIAGLVNGVPYVAFEILLSNPSVPFTPNAGPAPVSILDDFTSPAEGVDVASTANWLQSRGSTPLVPNASDNLTPNALAGADSGELNIIHADQPAAAQFAEITLAASPTSGSGRVGVILRWNADAPSDFIWVYFNGNSNFEVWNFVSGSGGRSVNQGIGGLSTGDTLRVEIDALHQLTVIKNPSDNPSTYGPYDLSGNVPITGQVGIYARLNSGWVNGIEITEFAGGDL
ncbi:MAG: hypothetical protein AAF862_06715 [Pseudomonadota bacterium]